MAVAGRRVREIRMVEPRLAVLLMLYKQWMEVELHKFNNPHHKKSLQAVRRTAGYQAWKERIFGLVYGVKGDDEWVRFRCKAVKLPDEWQDPYWVDACKKEWADEPLLDNIKGIREQRKMRDIVSRR